MRVVHLLSVVFLPRILLQRFLVALFLRTSKVVQKTRSEWPIVSTDDVPSLTFMPPTVRTTLGMYECSFVCPLQFFFYIYSCALSSLSFHPVASASTLVRCATLRTTSSCCIPQVPDNAGLRSGSACCTGGISLSPR